MSHVHVACRRWQQQVRPAPEAAQLADWRDWAENCGEGPKLRVRSFIIRGAVTCEKCAALRLAGFVLTHSVI